MDQLSVEIFDFILLRSLMYLLEVKCKLVKFPFCFDSVYKWSSGQRDQGRIQIILMAM